MKRTTVFVFIFTFALLFVLSLVIDSACPYRQPMSIVGQAGLAISLIIFFLLPGTKARRR